QNRRDLPRDIPLDSVVVLRYEKRSKSENKGKVPTEMELVLEQTQQGTSYEVSVSAEGVEELKRKVKIKGEKKEALLTLRQKPGRSSRRILKGWVKSLILPSREVNVDDSADKSSSETNVQPVTQPKAPTDPKLRKKKTPPSSKPKTSKLVRDVPPKKQVAGTQPADVPVATADTTKCLDASESAEEQGNQTISSSSSCFKEANP
ncbi:hypothetical protein Tco_1155283, partial [Tanacetum coccineum]